MRYAIPARRHRTHDEIERSRFIATVDHASTVDEAEAFIRAMREEFLDATHNCWAYVIGPPGSTTRIGMSDDGEPHGTAGRPMLTALLHGGMGDVVAVVTRYYGGTKLGTGGLVRAYGGSLQRTLLETPRAERVDWATLTLLVGYGDVTVIRQLAAAHEGELLAEEYGADVTYTLRLPVPNVPAFESAIRDATRGTAIIEVAGPEPG
jgi:uncharacterized YigZ family protein